MHIKTSTALLIGAVLLTGAGFLLFTGGTSTDGSRNGIVESAAVLSADRPLHDFGKIDIFSGTVTTEFLLTNEGADDITITGGTTTCGCTEGELGGMRFGMHEELAQPFVIPAGGTVPLSVIFDPLAHGPSGVGLAQRSVFLKTDSSATPELEVQIQALVTNIEQ